MATNTIDLAEQSDSELLAVFVRDRDEVVFREFVRRYGGLVLSVARRVTNSSHDADDVFQATFLKLAMHAPRLSSESLSGWLYRVAYRFAIRGQRFRSSSDTRGGCEGC